MMLAVGDGRQRAAELRFQPVELGRPMRAALHGAGHRFEHAELIDLAAKADLVDGLADDGFIHRLQMRQAERLAAQIDRQG